MTGLLLYGFRNLVVYFQLSLCSHCRVHDQSDHTVHTKKTHWLLLKGLATDRCE